MGNLTTRLVIFLMLALMIITGVNDYRRLLRERERLIGQSEEDVRIFAETFALAVSRNVRWGRTTAELKELLDDILARPGLVAVAIYDPEGRVVADNVSAGMAALAADEVVHDTLKTKEAALDLVAEKSTPVVRYVQPFRWPGGRTAAIEVRQTLEGTEAVFHRAVRDSIISRLVVLALFVLSIVTVTRWNIARPIRALMAGAQAVGRGDLAQRILIRRRDEIGQLAEEFNRMAANLQAAHDQLMQQAEERLRLEREVQQAQKLAAVGMLAAEVAHEIGTPLNVIAGRAEGLGRVVDPGHPERRGLDVIVEQTQRISKIIRALLDYSRPRRLTIRDEEILPTLRRVADLVEERSRRRGVRIELDLPDALPQVLADPDQLQQIFLNLMLNALDASPQGERVRVAVGPDPILSEDGRVGIVRGTIEGASLAIHVLDTGKGMTAEQIDHVFEPFFSTKEQGQGTGLGLPIVEQIIRAHRGEIEVLSIPGQGTEVIVRLLLAAKEAVPDSPGTELAQEVTNHGA